MRVRAYQPADRAAVLALARRLTTGVASWRDPAAVLAAVQGWVEQSVEGHGGAGAVFVAEDQDRVVGFVTVTRRRHFAGEVEGYVGELAVAEQDARAGAGRALMQAAEDWTRDQGLRRLSLETGAGNHVARGFYQALGYVEEDVRLSRALVDPPRR